MIGNLSPAHMALLKKVQDQVRAFAKSNGVKVRRHRQRGIDVKYPNGDKAHYFGWVQLKLDLESRFGKVKGE